MAWHPYLGTIDAMTRVHDAYPDKHVYWTEGDFGAVGAFAGGGLAGAAPVASTDAPKREPVPPAVKMALGGALAAAAVRNWTRCLMLWNIVLDENGNPNIGPFTGASGTITIDSKTKEITRGTDYWVLKHYTHAAPRGSKRFASHGGGEAVAHAAFVSRDDTKVLVLSNTTAGDKQVQVRVGGLMTQITLPAHSITNLSWV